jgi:pyruvate kinase
MTKQTKIVCTIGPASEKPEIMEKMIKAGMNIARLNFSHGTYANHAALIKNLRYAAKKAKMDIGILQDLQGPKIRVGLLPKPIILKSGQAVVLTVDVTPSGEARDNNKIPVTYKGMASEVKGGHRILMDDGLIELEVQNIFKKDIRAKVKIGGPLSSHKGINLPDSLVKLSSLTPKDKEDVKFGLKKGVDFISLSFVKSKEDVLDLRKILPKKNPPFIIAKIEKHEAVKNFDKILEVVDGIMVARGDLAVEIPAEQVPVAQKDIVAKCLRAAKPVIVATQMLQSMTENPRPTRAEVSDVANAVIDHADATMLSAESATGKYPALAVETMSKIINNTEISRYDDLKSNTIEILKDSEALGEVAKILSETPKVKAVVVASESADIVRQISRFRPEAPIFSAVTDEKEGRGLMLSWGVKPFYLGKVRVEKLAEKLLKLLKKQEFIKNKDKIILIKNGKRTEEVEIIN